MKQINGKKKRTGNLETGPYTVCASGGFGYIYYVSIDMGNVHFGKNYRPDQRC